MRWILGVLILATLFVVAHPCGPRPLYGDWVSIFPAYDHLDPAGGFYFNPVSGPDQERNQMIIDDSVFWGFGGPVLIDSIALRLDKRSYTTSATFDDITVQLSTAATTPSTFSTTLADNVGSDVVTVRSGPLTLSSASGVADPSQFDVLIPFLVPFTYDPLAGDLLFDWVYSGHFNNGAFQLDLNWNHTSPYVNTVAYNADAVPVPDGFAEAFRRGACLVAQFSVTATNPEPSAVMLAMWALLLPWRRRRRR
ncbi:MAG: hypothetical protein OSA43_04120 [Pirellulales bacterium]|jgi:hypothetical protein|nr:hypothetical protein [Pirellulales bacterium]